MALQYPLPPGIRLTHEQRRKVASDAATHYAGGKSVRQIADVLGLSYGRCHDLLTKVAQVQLRPPGTRTRPRRSQ